MRNFYPYIYEQLAVLKQNKYQYTAQSSLALLVS